jgi:hypothetical protein
MSGDGGSAGGYGNDNSTTGFKSSSGEYGGSNDQSSEERQGQGSGGIQGQLEKKGIQAAEGFAKKEGW